MLTGLETAGRVLLAGESSSRALRALRYIHVHDQLTWDLLPEYWSQELLFKLQLSVLA